MQASVHKCVKILGDRDKDDSNSQCAFVCEMDKCTEVSGRYSQPTEEQARHLLGDATRDVVYRQWRIRAHDVVPGLVHGISSN